MKKIGIKGDVVDDQTGNFYEYFGMSCVHPSAVQGILDDGDQNEPVTVNIASNGGDVFAASEIYTALKSYKGVVTVNIQGLAASAASVIAMAGDTVNISPTAQLMIHKASSWGEGNSDDFDKQSEVLSGIDKSIANAYEAKTGKDRGEILQLMAEETWMDAKTAVDDGFADAIMTFDSEKQPVLNATHTIINKSAVNKFLALKAKAQKTEQKKPKQQKVVDKKDQLKNKLAILLG